MALGLEPFDLCPLSVLAFALVIAKAVRGHAGRVGWLAGLGYFGAGLENTAETGRGTGYASVLFTF